jgi:hypothetical protein
MQGGALRPSSRLSILSVALLTAFGFAVRSYGIGKLDLWYDEMALWFYALTGDAYAIEAPHEPPLMAYLVLGVMIWLRSTDALMGHMVSIILGTMTIPFAYLMGVSVTRSPVTGLLSALCVAMSPMAIYYSREMRPYSLLILVSAGLYLGLLYVSERATRSAWLVYAGVAGTACLSHVAVAQVMVVLALFALVVLFFPGFAEGSWRHRRRWAAHLALITVTACAPCCIWIWQRMQLAPQHGYTFSYTFDGIYDHGFSNYVRELLVGFGPGPVMSYAGVHPWGQAELLGAVFALLYILGLIRLYSTGRRQPALLFALAVAVPAVILYVTTGRRWGLRYISHALVPFLLVVAVGLNFLRERFRGISIRVLVVGVFIVLLMPWTLNLQWYTEVDRYRETASYLERHAHELRGVLVLPYLLSLGDADLRILNIHAYTKREQLPVYHVSFGEIRRARKVPSRGGLTEILWEGSAPEVIPSGRYAVLSRKRLDDCSVLTKSLKQVDARARESRPVFEGLTLCDIEFAGAVSADVSPP